ncbi:MULTISPECIES: nicotinate phosphoribosyltransferase [unclassified Gilliamella]|uniref:nicotinate phosphoribosyltransferase n=1 Tax=unclassified Gilliamella TaxID=2685620 RepID=UPI00226A2513|nr:MULTISPECIES: nicotinate phosphoribosyltransferase [unclassified Gilliamella]MCX8601183.1 nicotinate phosphoribosyltransferase [Gilliamella sp. B3722]MCX8607337.1 nicotinate phosphoribosyltransferase [Gilliamella sp. B3771]MCX8610474.1 nicotinate phosphoribosyltransferase [Gilliamella sp. B3891]MCX8612857.1 nicotinate phosphoribosyltransferase [Gilliamella sp. B3773]MCX8614766.1 nicotinate phosphoribosyltransferase [Gilliamella sp. B3770]
MLPAIITSILDTDAYKLHMQQAVFHHYPNATVVAEFRCRSDDLLGHYADQIKHQVKLMESLTLTDDEFNYLSNISFFQADYLNWLKNWRFNSDLLTIRNENGRLVIRIEGKWLDVILWEVPLLAVISEIVHHDRSPYIGVAEAIDRLKDKLEIFNQQTANIDMSGFNLMDFGTRRRYSFAVQEAVIGYLKDHFDNFHSTSNYLLAYRLGLTPVGTQAHEWFQAHQRLSPSLPDCQKTALQVWLDEYPNDLGVALTDCITMDAFLRDFDWHFASRYQGLRHDSGDPIQWGEKAISHYQQLGIDPKSKLLVFSDSLNFDKALKIYQHFNQRVKLAFGIGGHLACDIPSTVVNTKALNIVIKLTECNRQSVAKLSDSPGKTISQDQAFIDELKRTFRVKH